MPIIRITAEDLRRPENSAEIIIGEESAAHCDGLVCGQYFEDAPPAF